MDIQDINWQCLQFNIYEFVKRPEFRFLLVVKD